MFGPLNIIIRNERDHKVDMISIIRNKSILSILIGRDSSVKPKI